MGLTTAVAFWREFDMLDPSLKNKDKQLFATMATARIYKGLKDDFAWSNIAALIIF